MKKHLLSTSAIALGVAVAAPASAEEWDLSWGGYFQSHAVYVNAGGPAVGARDFDGLNFMNDAEIHFNPSITLDNGLTFAARVELEGQSAAGNQIDHTFMSVSGDTLGTIQFGNLNSVTYNNSFMTPGVGSIGINSGTMSNFIPLVTVGGFTGFPTTSPDMTGDSMKINYITPDFNGFSLGISYTPTVAGNSINTGPINRNLAGRGHDVFGVSASYAQTFGTTSVALNAFYQQGEAIVAGVNTDPNNWGVGATLGFGDFSVGFNYAETDADQNAATDKTETWSLGGTYNTGVWTFGIDMVMAEYDAVGTGGAKVEETAYRIGASRSLGTGVTWDMFAISYDGDDKGGTANDIDATLIGTAITLNF